MDRRRTAGRAERRPAGGLTSIAATSIGGLERPATRGTWRGSRPASIAGSSRAAVTFAHVPSPVQRDSGMNHRNFGNVASMFPHHTTPWVVCHTCKAPLPVDAKFFVAYFEENLGPCPNCKSPVDWYKAITSGIDENFMLTGAYSVIGASTSILEITLTKQKNVLLDFSQHGIPTNALILSINYSPVGAEGGVLFPMEVWGNVPARDPIPHEITIFAAPVGEAPPQAGKCHIAVTWLAPSEDEVATHHFVDAVRQYSAARYNGVIVPANVAVESALTPAVAETIEVFCSKENAGNFLKNAATYSHQLNVLIPITAHLVNAPKLPDLIRGKLNELRRLRNEIAHTGKPDTSVTKERAAELLTAALFGYYYARLLHERVRLAKSALVQAVKKGQPRNKPTSE